MSAEDERQADQAQKELDDKINVRQKFDHDDFLRQLDIKGSRVDPDLEKAKLDLDRKERPRTNPISTKEGPQPKPGSEDGVEQARMDLFKNPLSVRNLRRFEEELKLSQPQPKKLTQAEKELQDRHSFPDLQSKMDDFYQGEDHDDENRHDEYNEMPVEVKPLVPDDGYEAPIFPKCDRGLRRSR